MYIDLRSKISSTKTHRDRVYTPFGVRDAILPSEAMVPMVIFAIGIVALLCLPRLPRWRGKARKAYSIYMYPHACKHVQACSIQLFN
jgi:hypothetical protein